MKITYTGKIEKLQPAQQTKFETRIAKLGKLLDRKYEKDARVVVTTERHLTNVEIRGQWYDHPLVCTGSDADVFNALTKALDKLEKQVLKLQAKWRDSKRTSTKEKAVPVAEPTPVEAKPKAAPKRAEGPDRRVYRVNRHDGHKPMTVEEAVLELGKNKDYLVYRDAETDRLSVLVRRRDGHFDLVEA